MYLQHSAITFPFLNVITTFCNCNILTITTLGYVIILVEKSAGIILYNILNKIIIITMLGYVIILVEKSAGIIIVQY